MHRSFVVFCVILSVFKTFQFLNSTIIHINSILPLSLYYSLQSTVYSRLSPIRRLSALLQSLSPLFCNSQFSPSLHTQISCSIPPYSLIAADGILVRACRFGGFTCVYVCEKGVNLGFLGHRWRARAAANRSSSRRASGF